ncbi:MAG: hypothetical protein KF847_08825 [Pirellulales bacterium]|nr:hypothetical protein [Pirellulales bacterium]
MRTMQSGMIGAVLLAWLAGGRAQAHFPWLAADDAGRALLFFSEHPSERDYRVPDCLKEAIVSVTADGSGPQALELTIVESDEFTGRQSAEEKAAAGVLACPVAYGNYNGMLLTYHAKGCLGSDPAKWASCPELKLDATPQIAAGKLLVTAVWEGKPLVGAKATLLPASGESTSATTDDRGIAEFSVPASGLTGCIVERLDKNAKGRANDAPYSTAVDYATVSFEIPAGVQPNLKVAPLPNPVASFGGAVSGGRLYVYSGHTGEEHAHSRDNLSGKFLRIKLSSDGDSSWEDLPMGTPLQGLPLVAHRGKLYRVGGLSFRNAAEEEEDMHSVDEFAAFDPRAKSWTELPPLPEARSSHDAAVVGDALYVVGGWTLSGSSPGNWLPTAWAYHLTRAGAAWEALPSPPFKRRALAAAAWDGKLAAIGGMDDAGKVSRRCDLFDPVSGQWTRLPDLPGSGMDGFGVSAWAIEDRLFASSADGVLYCLSPGADEWTEAGELETPRFFHRLLPTGDGGLLAVAGASPEEGHVATVETIRP